MLGGHVDEREYAGVVGSRFKARLDICWLLYFIGKPTAATPARLAILVLFSPNSPNILVDVADKLFMEHVQPGPPLIENLVSYLDRPVTQEPIFLPVCNHVVADDVFLQF